MIWWNRITRYLNNDMYLPTKCNSKEYNIYFYKGCSCDCKIFCKYPKRNTLSIIKMKR